MTSTWICLLTTLTIAAGLQPAAGQAAIPPPEAADREARHLANTLMSPFCPGRTLATCPSTAAYDLQEEIRAELRAGVTSDSIERRLVAVYGEAMRGVPRARGFGLLAWAVPASFFVLGGAAVIGWARRMGRATRAEPLESPAIDAHEAQRLTEELRRLV